jgi:hypothetical protein
VLCTGDLFIWASPSAGNPQKVQRYPPRMGGRAPLNARPLRRAGGSPEVLLPGHGYPIVGADRIRRALDETAELLESLVAQTLECMNAGARLDEAIHAVTPPAHLQARPDLQPAYDDPEFVVRSVWRLSGGWWDGNPATLKPAPERAVARELADLSGGPGRLADRATALLVTADSDSVDDQGAGDHQGGGMGGTAEDALRLAGHLAEMAWLAAPDDPAVAQVRRTVFTRRAGEATSTMARASSPGRPGNPERAVTHHDRPGPAVIEFPAC